MFLIPIFCFFGALGTYIVSTWHNIIRVNCMLIYKFIMIISSEYAALFFLHYCLNSMAADYKGKIPFLVVCLCCILPYIYLLFKELTPYQIIIRFFKSLSVIATIVLMIECFVFNLKSFSLQQQSECISWDCISYQDNTKFDDNKLTISDNSEIFLLKIPDYTQGLLLSMERETDNDCLPFHVVLGMKDDNFTEDYITVQEKYEIGTNICQFSIHPYGKIRSIKLGFSEISKPFVITAIRCVSRLPFEFSALRFWALFIALALINAIISFKWYQILYKRTQWIHIILVSTTILICTMCSSMFYWPNQIPVEYNGTASISDPYAMTFDAFQKKQVWLDLEADPNLEMVDNVYVKAQRESSGANYYWDYAYYQGRYYSYFGITPVIVFYYPYFGIFKMLPTMNMGNALFGSLSVIFLCFTIISLLKIFYPHPNLLLLLLLIFTATSTFGAYWVMNGGGLYHLTTASGLCFLFLSLWTGINAYSIKKYKCKLLLLFVSGLALVLCVGSRPTIALNVIILVPLFISILFDYHMPFIKRLLQAVTFLFPLGVGAGGLMWYNYMRFGSAFDFGAAYQLTVSNIKANKLFVSDLWGAIYNYFLLTPRPRASFPFFEPQWGNLYNFQHYVYVEGTYGWLCYPYIALSVLLAPRVLARNIYFLHNRKNKDLSLIITVLCFLTPVFLSWLDFSMGGVNQRYLYDVSPLLIIGCCLVLLCCNTRAEKNRYLYIISCVSLGLSFVISWLLMIENHDCALVRQCPNLYNTVENLIVFWQ